MSMHCRGIDYAERYVFVVDIDAVSEHAMESHHTPMPFLASFPDKRPDYDTESDQPQRVGDSTLYSHYYPPLLDKLHFRD